MATWFGREDVRPIVALAIALAAPATAAAPLPLGSSAWIYDYDPAWVTAMQSFNTAASPARRLRSLYPYGGWVEVPVAGQLIFSAATYDNTLAQQYAAAFPDVVILPIIDGSHSGTFDNWSDAQYEAAAQRIADVVLADPFAHGAQVDIEPYRPSQVHFYEHLGVLLRAGGKLLTTFVGGAAAHLELFAACDVVVLSGYDLFPIATGPLPADYGDRLETAVAAFDATAAAAGGWAMVGVPAITSAAEFEYFEEPPTCPRQDSGHQQIDYLREAHRVLCAHEDDPALLGTAVWALARRVCIGWFGCCFYPVTISDEEWRLLASGCGSATLLRNTEWPARSAADIFALANLTCPPADMRVTLDTNGSDCVPVPFGFVGDADDDAHMQGVRPGDVDVDEDILSDLSAALTFYQVDDTPGIGNRLRLSKQATTVRISF